MLAVGHDNANRPNIKIISPPCNNQLDIAVCSKYE